MSILLEMVTPRLIEMLSIPAHVEMLLCGKIECVGHIQKRMGGRLRRKKKDLKGKKLVDGETIGGRNRLADNLIDTFQRYYVKAFRQNKGGLDGMEEAVKAIWYHFASTDECPMHQYCPGADPWCKWQKDKVNGTRTFQAKKVAPAVMKEILPVFEALWDRKLLESVLEGLSQNNNEAVNHLVWDISPKKIFNGPETIQTACTLVFSMVDQKAFKLYRKGSI